MVIREENRERKKINRGVQKRVCIEETTKKKGKTLKIKR
jgi:hypothetical protein